MSRKFLIASVIVAVGALMVAPAAYAAMMSNSYGMEFAGQDKCLECHQPVYGDTTHSDFMHTDVEPDPTTYDFMWAAGRVDLGMWVDASDIAFMLGANTGMREYIRWDAAYIADPTMPVRMSDGMEWSPDMPTTWEYGDEGIQDEAYTCYRCHVVGPQATGSAPPAGTKFEGAAAADWNGWAVESWADTDTVAGYIPGSSIQCERCHGMGEAATAGQDGHWNSGVKVVGGWSSDRFGLAANKNILDSGVCGQCHATYKSGNVYGFTTDQYLQEFAEYYTVDESYNTPTRFWPNGENKGMKHSYYTEWTVSAHAYRPRVATDAPNATEYNKADLAHFGGSSIGSRPDYCFECHTGEGYLKRKDAPVMTDFPDDTSQMGYYGQECAVCHVSHGASTDSGMDVREPDQAGEGSCAGLATDNASICEDCHNWQAEISGSPIVPTTSGRGPSHPQRELVHGKGMYEIPAAEQFMPNVRCEECHMPATRSDYPDQTQLTRYANQSWKRYSHRMFIMEPEDAYDWGLDPWGDSCSPCHPGLDQIELQEYIDDWQAEADALDVEALAAIEASKLRTEYGTSAGQALAGRAFVNEKMFANDGSSGAHNPPYVQAGLEKAIQLSDFIGGDFDKTFAPETVSIGGYGAVAATVDNGDGTPAEGAMVTLQSYTSATGWQTVGMTTSDANGNVSFMVAPAVTTIYRFRWDRCESSTADLYSDQMTVEVAKTPTALTVRSSSYYVTTGDHFELAGKMTPADVGATLDIYYKWSGSTADWKPLTTTTVNSAGSYYKNIQPWKNGFWYYKVVYSESSTFLGSEVIGKIKAQ